MAVDTQRGKLNIESGKFRNGETRRIDSRSGDVERR